MARICVNLHMGSTIIGSIVCAAGGLGWFPPSDSTTHGDEHQIPLMTHSPASCADNFTVVDLRLRSKGEIIASWPAFSLDLCISASSVNEPQRPV